MSHASHGLHPSRLGREAQGFCPTGGPIGRSAVTPRTGHSAENREWPLRQAHTDSRLPDSASRTSSRNSDDGRLLYRSMREEEEKGALTISRSQHAASLII